ncbi:hypothetical protein QYE76_063997 [Lolium multiflorum]|uniref:Transposase-associated domain-containing protein n=1 Tax=Lolium multiflorum TaxID=4521 RepID=A0AAD8S626_LOLMU|nr:hypothetical protein QYE76_063997 [Lolium multiflorum]
MNAAGDALLPSPSSSMEGMPWSAPNLARRCTRSSLLQAGSESGERRGFSLREFIDGGAAVAAVSNGRRATTPTTVGASVPSGWRPMVLINLQDAMPTRMPLCSSTMNRQWMYIDRRFDEFTSGLENFIAVAEANKHGGFMYCPCVDCKNIVNYAHSSVIHSHLLRAGFMPSYYCWTKHGERGVMMEENEEEEEDDDGYPNFPEYDDTAEGNEDNEVEDQEAPDEPADDLGRAIADARRECETEKERRDDPGDVEGERPRKRVPAKDSQTRRTLCFQVRSHQAGHLLRLLRHLQGLLRVMSLLRVMILLCAMMIPLCMSSLLRVKTLRRLLLLVRRLRRLHLSKRGS